MVGKWETNVNTFDKSKTSLLQATDKKNQSTRRENVM
jgi:hypothetical protein